MPRIGTYLLSLLLPLTVQAQFSFDWPMKHQQQITGNYGELRTNHFHTGIDFSTNNQVNLPVYSAAPGYVSRIRLSSVGYGKCIYVTHPGGFVTVYAHLNAFAPKIAAYLDAEMLRLKVNEIDHYPEKGLLTVTENELLGLSGNSGGSTGPHLHFEVREELSEIPRNPLLMKQVKDSVSPVIRQVAFYDLSDSLQPEYIRSTPAKGGARNFVFERGILGLAFSAVDRVQLRGNDNNVFSASLYVDGNLLYSHQFAQLDFADGRFVNEYADTRGREKFQKCFLPSCWPPSFQVITKNRGRISFEDTLEHRVKLLVTDEAGNSDEFFCTLRTNGRPEYRMVKRSGEFVDCRFDQAVRDNGVYLKIPARSLYNHAMFRIARSQSPATFSVLPAGINLHAAIQLGIPVPLQYRAHPTQVVLRNKDQVYVGQLHNDSIFYSVKSAGTFTVLRDSVPPQLSLVPKRGKASAGFQLWKMSDKLSGVQTYNLFLNEEWVLCEYDAKSSTLMYRYRETDRGPLQFRLAASDRCGNSTSLESRLNR